MNNLAKYIEHLGISLYGYADLRGFDEEKRESLPFGIAMGIALDPKIIARIPDGPFEDYVEVYSSVTARLDEIAVSVRDYLIERGHRAVAQDRPYVNSQTSSDLHSGDIPAEALMPHKTVVATAGLGWIGKNALVITKEYGSAIRFTSVLTDAPLDAVDAEYSCLCGSCRICADSCPGGAIYSRLWEPGISRTALFDYHKCNKGLAMRAEKLGIKNGGGTCGMCIAVCPHTRRYLNAAL